MDDLEKDLKDLKKREKKIKKTVFVDNDNKVLKKLKEHLKPYNAESNMKVLPIKYKGKNVLQVTIADSRYKSKGYTRNKMQSIGNDLSRLLHNNGVDGYIWSTLKFDSQYRTGQYSNIGNDVNLYLIGEYDGDEMERMHEQKTFKKAIFYIGETKVLKKGGADNKYNDCMYFCLHYALFNENPFKSAKKLKDYLGLKRPELIHIDLIPKIEEKLKHIKINITGDAIYSSTLICPRVINIKLINGHYSLDHKINSKVSYMSFEERKPLIHDKIKKLFYDGKKEFASTIEVIEDSNHFKSDYILIPKSNKSKSMKEEYDEFVKTADRLIEISKGEINLYKTGTIKNTALKLFDKFTKTIITPDHCKQDESIWIQESSIGANIFYEEYEGRAYKYDVKSMYPNIQNSTKLCIPIKRGEFGNMTKVNFDSLKFYPYGFYRCKILKSDNNDINKLFRFNTLNKYTHIDLTSAKDKGLKIELIEDNTANVLLYSRDKLITCHELFNKYVDYLFPLKELYNKELPIIKQIINILWGALGQVEKTRKIINHDREEEYNIEDDKTPSLFKPTFDGKGTIVDIIENNYFFKSSFARIKPFLLAKGRSIISNILFPFKEIVVRCHTDSGYFKEYPKGIKTGDKIGDFVYEGCSSHCIISSNAKPKGEDFKL